MYLPLKMRIRLAKRNARQWRTQCAVFDMTCTDIHSESILHRLGPKQVVDYSQELIVTDVGFITMALLPSDARYCEQLLVIPGVDDHNQYGYLVLRAGALPYHSLAASIELAAVEAQGAWDRSAKLVQSFGGVAELKEAVAKAPWYLTSRLDDAVSAGLCQWGIDSFLRRLCLRRICQFITLPKIVIRLAGAYGCRVTAATLVRQQRRLYETPLNGEQAK